MDYHANLIWDHESGGDVYFHSFPQLNLKLDIPESFGGKGRYPCPDELFLSSIGGCLLTTCLFFKQKLELNLQELRVSIQGRVKYIGPKGYRLKEITAIIFILVEEPEQAKARECVDLTKEYCHLTRSLEKGLKVARALGW